MTVRVPRSKAFYTFSPHLTPCAHAQQNEKIIFETYDCYEGQIRKPEDLHGELDMDRIDPATGPVYIEGVKRGDILKVAIDDIVLDSQAVVVCSPEAGALNNFFRESEAVILPIQKNKIIYKDRIHLPIDPMVGVIGVAPAGEDIATETPDDHGSNMDCTALRKGSVIYFTAGIDGALLGCGDVHAVMGDGEVLTTAAEADAEVHLRASIAKMQGLPTPFMEDEKMVATVCSAVDLNEAAEAAIHRMTAFLTEFAGMTINDAGMLMSLAGDLKFCQVVNPKRTVRFEFPKQVLADYGYIFNN